MIRVQSIVLLLCSRVFSFCKTLGLDECNKTGIPFMDTCLVSSNGSAFWTAAWDDCFRRGARLLELPNVDYYDAYRALSSSLFKNEEDLRWLGFIRNTSAEPPI